MANPKEASWYGVAGAGELVSTRPAGLLPQSTTDILFTVSGGPVLCVQITGIVTVEVGAVGNNTKLTHVATDICSVLDITGDVVGIQYSITGTFANALIATALGVPLAKQATEFVLPVGNLLIDCAGSDGAAGYVEWSLVYKPLSEASVVVAVP